LGLLNLRSCLLLVSLGLMGAITVIPSLVSSSLLLLLEEEDSLDSEELSSCGGLDESPTWTLSSSLIETEEGEIWR
jgi:hypothetical protein